MSELACKQQGRRAQDRVPSRKIECFGYNVDYHLRRYHVARQYYSMDRLSRAVAKLLLRDAGERSRSTKSLRAIGFVRRILSSDVSGQTTQPAQLACELSLPRQLLHRGSPRREAGEESKHSNKVSVATGKVSCSTTTHSVGRVPFSRIPFGGRPRPLMPLALQLERPDAVTKQGKAKHSTTQQHPATAESIKVNQA